MESPHGPQTAWGAVVGGLALGRPRFLILQGAARRPRGPVPPEAGGTSAVAWRLVSGNNRELGRSAVYHWGADACIEAVDSLTRAVHRAQTRLSLSPATGLWGWVLTLDGEPVAMSGRGYHREREARYSLDQFLAGAPVADVSPGVRQVVWGADAVGSLAPAEGLR